MAKFSVQTRNNRKDLLGIDKMLLVLNEPGRNPQNLSNKNKQQTKFDKNLRAGSISVE